MLYTCSLKYPYKIFLGIKKIPKIHLYQTKYTYQIYTTIECVLFKNITMAGFPLFLISGLSHA